MGARVRKGSGEFQATRRADARGETTADRPGVGRGGERRLKEQRGLGQAVAAALRGALTIRSIAERTPALLDAAAAPSRPTSSNMTRGRRLGLWPLKYSFWERMGTRPEAQRM